MENFCRKGWTTWRLAAGRDGLPDHEQLQEVWKIGEKALSSSFYIGTTIVRLLPHASDLYRAHGSTWYLYSSFMPTMEWVSIPLPGTSSSLADLVPLLRQQSHLTSPRLPPICHSEPMLAPIQKFTAAAEFASNTHPKIATIRHIRCENPIAFAKGIRELKLLIAGSSSLVYDRDQAFHKNLQQSIR
ncbi:hypothetical protein FH972_015212 [Carpinus fangiana]|uniref:Uncharacterized protein n=1 Tax=Carpinus fangiana TaxID=176857 RepID=A0A5N6RCD8_9ROSI|nr:hypothetical protein FH972_015212 [Carpinus fangiana]